MWQLLLPQSFWSSLKRMTANCNKVLRGLFNPIGKRSSWNLLLSVRYRSLLSSFITVRKEKNPNFKNWWQYMDMVCILLLFVRSQKEGIWDLNLYAFHKMLPFFFSSLWSHKLHAMGSCVPTASEAFASRGTNRVWLGQLVKKAVFKDLIRSIRLKSRVAQWYRKERRRD